MLHRFLSQTNSERRRRRRRSEIIAAHNLLPLLRGELVHGVAAPRRRCWLNFVGSVCVWAFACFAHSPLVGLLTYLRLSARFRAATGAVYTASLMVPSFTRVSLTCIWTALLLSAVAVAANATLHTSGDGDRSFCVGAVAAAALSGRGLAGVRSAVRSLAQSPL